MIVKIQRGEETIVLPDWDSRPHPTSLFAISLHLKPGLVVSEADKTGTRCALNTTINASLREEGIARELLRHIQVLRQSAGLNICDRIELSMICDNDEVRSIFDSHRKHFQSEALAIIVDEIKNPLGETNITFDSCDIHLKIARLG